MPSLVVTYPFAASATGFSPNPGAATTMAWTGSNGNPAGSLSTALTGSNKTNNNNWSLTTTWVGLGVPSDATVTGISVLSIDSRCTAFTGGTSCTSGAVTLADGATTITLSVQRLVSATDPAWVNTPGTGVSGISLPATHSITITIPTHLQTTSGGSGKGVTVLHDNLTFTIAYRRAFADVGAGGLGRGGRATVGTAFAPLHSGGVDLGGAATSSQGTGGSTLPIEGLTGRLMVTQGFSAPFVPVLGSTVPIEGLTGPLMVTLGFAAVAADARPATGGMRHGGVVMVSPAYAETGVGGERLGGSPVVSHARRELPAGGMTQGAGHVFMADYTAYPEGGVRYGGRAVVTAPPPPYIVTGGVRHGGAAAAVAVAYAEAGIGGLELGGIATIDPFHDYVKFAAGGVEHGGRAAAPAAFVPRVFGGMRQGGRAVVSAGRVPVPAGGMRCGGAAYRTLFSSGGVRYGGSAAIGHSFSAYPDPFAATARTGDQ